MKNIIFLILITMSLNSINGQNLNGKWHLKDIKVNDNKNYPGFHLLEIIDKNAVLYFDFLMVNKLELKLIDNIFYLTNDKKYAELVLKSENHIKLLADGTANDKEAVFELNYHRLLPTKTSLNISEIETFTYLATENNKIKTELKFNQELLNIEEINKQKKGFREEMRIEKIDSTFFLSIFHFDKRGVSLPIKEITNEFIKFYFIPTEDKEITAFRKK